MSHESSHTLAHALIEVYQLGELVSMEAFGPVYNAVNTSTGEEVWFHHLTSPDDQPLSPERFKHAMFTVRGLESPHLVGVEGFGQLDEPELTYVTYRSAGLSPFGEAVPWLTPKGALAEGEGALQQVRRWAGELLGALGVIHAKRSTHLALSMETLWLTTQGELKVSHMGLATAFKRRLSSSMAGEGLIDDPLLLARAAYVSPEEVKGRLTQPVADLYAAACLLFEWLTGDLPIEAESAQATLKAQLDRPLQVSESFSQLSPTLQAFFEVALNKEPRGRYPSAQELLSAFLQALESVSGASSDSSNALESLDATQAEVFSKAQEAPPAESSAALEMGHVRADHVGADHVGADHVGVDDEAGFSTLLDLDDEPNDQPEADINEPPQASPQSATEELVRGGDATEASPLTEEPVINLTERTEVSEPQEPSDELSDPLDEETSADELAFGFPPESDDLGFSQAQSDERTFLEFSDVDDQTVFEADIQDEIEETHKSAVIEPTPRPSAARVSAIAGAQNPTPTPSTPTSVPMRTEAFASVGFDQVPQQQDERPSLTPPPAALQTLGFTSPLNPEVRSSPTPAPSVSHAPSAQGSSLPNLAQKAPQLSSHLTSTSEEMLGQRLGVGDEPYEPSRVVELPVVQAPVMRDDFGLEGAADLSSIQSAPMGAQAYTPSAHSTPAPVTQPSPQQATPYQATPYQAAPASPFGVPTPQQLPSYQPAQGAHQPHQSAPPSPFAQPAHATPELPLPPPKNTSRSLNPLLMVAALLTLFGGVGWALMSGMINLKALGLGAGPVALKISTQPSQEMGLFIQRSLRVKTPHEYRFNRGEQVGDELALRFTSSELLLNAKVPVFEGSAWVTLLTAPPFGVKDQGEMSQVIIESSEPQAKVSMGMEPIGYTPLILLGARGQRLNLIVETLGQEQPISLTFGQDERVKAEFSEPTP